MHLKLSRVGRLLIPWIVPAILLLLWEYAGRNAGSIYLPPLSDVLVRLREDWMWDRTRTDLLPSLRRFAVGYLLGAAIGIVVGLVLGSSRRVADYTMPTMEFLRALPAVAVLPIAVLIFGLGDGMRVSIIAFGVLFPVLVNTIAGARSCRQERIDVARTFGLSHLQVMRRVVLPSAIPMISAGLRVGLPIALIMMVVSELVGGQNGIGFYLTQAQSVFNMAGMYTALVILGVLGNLMNHTYSWIETRRLHWASHL